MQRGQNSNHPQKDATTTLARQTGIRYDPAMQPTTPPTIHNPAPFKLERYFAQYEFSARYLLSSSDCESLAVRDVLALEAGAAEAFQQHWLGYTESPGAPSLRREIAKIYTQISPAQVLVHSGAEEAIFLFMHAMLQPGQHVIVPWPCYQSLAELARSIGCTVSSWQARPENNWLPDPDELRQMVRPETRLIVANTPHNPTGYLLSPDGQRALVDLARRHGLLLFSDEVYRESEHDPADRLPAACDLYENAVSLGVMSPSPSTGFPSASTTRPISASPTGTSAMRPVRLTESPSRTASVSPMTTTPTLSSSRLSAMPMISWGNSSNSPAITFSRPCRRAMPSPTDSTTPVSATSTSLP